MMRWMGGGLRNCPSFLFVHERHRVESHERPGPCWAPGPMMDAWMPSCWVEMDGCCCALTCKVPLTSSCFEVGVHCTWWVPTENYRNF